MENNFYPLSGSYNQVSPAIKPFEKLPFAWQEIIDFGNFSYLKEFCTTIQKIKNDFPEEFNNIPDYFKRYASDSFLLNDQLDKALEFFPLPPIGLRSSTLTDSLISLKLVNNKQINGHEILTLFGPKVTEFGKNYLLEILNEINKIIDQLSNECEFYPISEWTKKSYKYQYQVGTGTSQGYFLTKFITIYAYTFSNNPDTEKFIREITRQAENRIRQEFGISDVGEGWIAETRLFYEIKNYLKEYEVQQHASPRWLKRQHLDVFIPTLSIGLEYQGKQHDQPVDYFGGVKAFEKNKERDQRKLRICKRHGVNIIYVYPGYKISEVIEKISKFCLLEK